MANGVNGGPGASGVLVFNQRIYHRELPPSVSAGGTVDYVAGGRVVFEDVIKFYYDETNEMFGTSFDPPSP